MTDPSFQTSRKIISPIICQFEQYTCNSSTATWIPEYSARDVYGAAIGGWPSTQSLNPAFWHKVTEAFALNDTLFQQFISYKTRGFNVVPCTSGCKTDTICGLRALRAENGCVSLIR